MLQCSGLEISLAVIQPTEERISIAIENWSKNATRIRNEMKLQQRFHILSSLGEDCIKKLLFVCILSISGKTLPLIWWAPPQAKCGFMQ
jgi:hypothetical protein